ncbi:hypothetical protein EVAR_39381_1 [Eumeta japonica]|uniref:Uncharacterized protein n=1 Tax=Eumeta variegata TaxID=151549 RepID=A0A4C1ZCV0_EUMVA|nr:hypothetical protein EVAR_39381_1 [Eumeta japonica]
MGSVNRDAFQNHVGANSNNTRALNADSIRRRLRKSKLTRRERYSVSATLPVRSSNNLAKEIPTRTANRCDVCTVSPVRARVSYGALHFFKLQLTYACKQVDETVNNRAG